MVQETDEDLRRERKAIETFVNTFGGSYQKLDRFDIDYRVFDSSGAPIAYVEVKGRIRAMRSAYPLPISAKKLVKLIEKRLNPVVIWSCDDGIIYGKVADLIGEARVGGRSDRGNLHDNELMVYFEKQKALKYVRFI